MRRPLSSLPVLPALVAAALLSGACDPKPPGIEPDLTPPYLLGVEPSGNAVPVDATFRVRLSEPVLEKRLKWLDTASGTEGWDSVVLAKAEQEDYLVTAMGSPPLSVSQRGHGLATEVTLAEARDELTLRPLAPLDGLTSYVIILSKKIVDDHFNALITPETRVNETQVVRFTTVPAADRTRPTAKLLTPAPGATGVPVDLREIQVEFSEAMDHASVRAENIGLLETAGQTEVVPTEITWVDAVATLTLPSQRALDCGTLCAGLQYQLFVDPTAKDLAGNTLEAVAGAANAFTAASCTDSAPPVVATASVGAAPADATALVTWKTDEPSTSTVEYAAGDATAFASACASPGGACLTAVGADAQCTVDICHLAAGAAPCDHQVKVTGLTPLATYSYRVVSKDGGGRTTRSAVATFTTVAAPPKLVLTELLASPAGLSDANAGKFVEILNAGTVAVDLAATGSGTSLRSWALARCAEATCSSGYSITWPMKPTGTATTLAPGAYAVATGNAFDAALMGLPGGTLVLRSAGTSTTVLSNGLVAGTTYAYALLAPGGVPVSTYGAHLGVPSATANTGHSFERKLPGGADEANNWGKSTAAVGTAAGNFATPGAANSVSPR